MRGRHIIYYFMTSFVNAAESLKGESNMDFNAFRICDNVDLETILMDFESFYFVKFNKYPKISKKLDGNLVLSLLV